MSGGTCSLYGTKIYILWLFRGAFVRAVSSLKSCWLHSGKSSVTAVSIPYAIPNVRKGSR
jgi:hypothetical protein